MTKIGVFSSLFIAHCVFNGLLSYTCTMLNIVTIHALRKTPSLPMTLKALLLSLSASDLGVGLIVQPLYIVRLVMIIGEETQTQTYKIIEHMVPNNRESFLLCFLPWCCVLSGGKILGYSFSSPIPRNRDLQTRCYFNDLNLDFQQLSLVPMF